MLIQENMLQLP